MGDFERDLDDAAFDFERVVWPAIRERCGDGEFLSVEKYAGSRVARALDMYAGIDGLILYERIGMVRGIAIRVQWCETSWDTFTIRSLRSSGAETEYVKKARMILNKRRGLGPLYPYFTVQAYVTRRRIGRLIAAAVTTTETLFRYLETHPPLQRSNHADSNEFLYVPWDDYAAYTKALVVIRNQQPQWIPA